MNLTDEIIDALSIDSVIFGFKNEAVLKVIINYSFSISFFLLVFINVNAQRDCQNKLTEYNQRTVFPSEQLTDYEKCLEYIANIIIIFFRNKKILILK